MPAIVQPRRLNIRKTAFVSMLLTAFFVYTYFIRDPLGPPNPNFRGRTMGTTYEIKIVGSRKVRSELDAIYSEITHTLFKLNRQMSTYIDDSEISVFNTSTATNPYPISVDFAKVTEKAIELSHATIGAFDPTLDPLINLWGFGNKGQTKSPPSSNEVTQALARCNVEYLQLSPGPAIRKTISNLQLNLSAIAKGYAVDTVTELFWKHGWTNTYVEIGGEIRVSGHNRKRQPWRIGIDLPADNASPGEAIASVFALRNRAVATSGDYRNYFEDSNGNRRSHLIDPRTGTPISHRLASVSVTATNCMIADGIATALMVMGVEQGLTWVEDQDHVDALFIARETDGTFRLVQSTGLPPLLHSSR